MSTPHLTELIDLTPALDAALLGMTIEELRSTADEAPATTAAALIADLSPVQLREARAAVMAAVYPSARVIAEQAYARAWARARVLVDARTGEAEATLGSLDAAGDIPADGFELEVNPFAVGAVSV